MKRDLKKLANEEYDVLIIGAGIYGASATWDAALRGLKVALIEKQDFGHATSANSLKIMHGGLRYLQTLDLKRVRESIRERRILMHIAPNLVYPMPVIMPTYSYKLKSRPAMSSALLANDVLSVDRNRSEDPHKYIPNGYTMSSKKLRELIPGYDKYNLNGGALWYDCQCYNTERLLLSFILSATQRGADVANYVKAVDLLQKNGKAIGVRVEDTLTGEHFDIRAKMIVNNAGPWVDDILASINGASTTKKFNLSTAMNLVVNRNITGQYAAGLSGPYRHVFEDGREYNGYRILFFAPWRDKTIIGTNHLPYSGKQDGFKVTEAEIEEFLDAVNNAHPGANIKRAEVSYFYSGFLPMTGTNPKTGEVNLVKHYKIYDHQKTDNVDGIVSVVGVKYTTARDVAQKTINLICKRLSIPMKKSNTDTTRLYGGDIDRFEEFLNHNIGDDPYKLGESAISHLTYNYGSAINDIYCYGQSDPSWMRFLPGTNEVVRAEVLHAVREEMAMKLSDVVLRRTDIGSGEKPGDTTLVEIANIMGHELVWTDERAKAEIEEVKQLYVPA
ncbi:glycerol-3-phosphate dehydrogenase/oxidase [candidate division KSB1 bacterium]|nr:glycerol-3-phosphate dehydrogenase/oxidase [candidate division KSB1 bacterium]